jgi:hypothetical protein
MKSKIFVGCCLMAAMAMGQVSHVVPPGTDGVNPESPFNSWTTAATNIQEAVTAAAGQGWTNVWVSNGTYTLTSQVTIAAGMTVRSWHDGAIDRAGTIVNGGNLAGNPTTNRCFYINHADAVVAGFTITNGWAYGSNLILDQSGGGVYVNNGLLLDCVVVGCKAQAMDAGVMVQSAGVVRGCQIQGNNAPSAAGGARVWGGTLDDCDVVSNYTGVGTGGGIFLSHAGVVTNTRVKSNYAAGVGGGVYIASSGGLLTHSEISANTNNSHGAGVYAEGILPKVEYCKVNGNITYHSSGSGGGISLLNGASAGHCIVSNNVAVFGGGLYLQNGAACKYSDIIGNLGQSVGGGVRVLNTGLVENCRIMHNISPDCGGVYLQAGNDIKLRNSLIAGNVSTGGNSGGVYVYQGTGIVFQNSTIVSNYAAKYGGGVCLSSATTMVENCVVYFNKSGLAGAYSNFYHVTTDLICNNSCAAPSMDAYGVNNTVADPQFVAFAPDMDAGAWNFNLRAGSPCVNTGTNQPDWMLDVPDLDGKRRIDRFSGLVDMGCYEYFASGIILKIK